MQLYLSVTDEILALQSVSLFLVVTDNGPCEANRHRALSEQWMINRDKMMLHIFTQAIVDISQ